jgi:hypothetical protein
MPTPGNWGVPDNPIAWAGFPKSFFLTGDPPPLYCEDGNTPRPTTFPSISNQLSIADAFGGESYKASVYGSILSVRSWLAAMVLLAASAALLIFLWWVQAHRHGRLPGRLRLRQSAVDRILTLLAQLTLNMALLGALLVGIMWATASSRDEDLWWVGTTHSVGLSGNNDGIALWELDSSTGKKLCFDSLLVWGNEGDVLVDAFLKRGDFGGRVCTARRVKLGQYSPDLGILYRTGPSVGWVVNVKYWLLFILFAAITGALGLADLFRAARIAKATAGYCAGCGYDLRGSPGRCPECGASNPWAGA